MTERETIKISDMDIPFILGKGGRTKSKLSRVSGAKIDVQETDGKINLSGSPEAIHKCKIYISCLSAQRTGVVELPKEAKLVEDYILVTVPTDCIGIITGPHGTYLRQIEEDTCTLMFFLDGDDESVTSQLAIFGDEQNRRFAQLNILSHLESLVPGSVTSDITAKNTDDETFRELTQQQHLRTLLARKGALKKKIMSASGCFIEIIGTWVALVGHRNTRKLAENYIGFHINGLKTAVARTRSDCLDLQLPAFCIDLLTESVKESIETTSGVLLFTAVEPKGFTGVLMFSGCEKARLHADILVKSFIEKKYPGHYSDNQLDRKTDNPLTEVDTLRLQSDEVEALTSQTGLLQSIRSASGSVIELLGPVIHFIGCYDERRLGRLYTKLIFENTFKGTATVPETALDSDVATFTIPTASAKLLGSNRIIVSPQVGLAIVSTPSSGTPTVVVCASSAASRVSVRKTADQYLTSLITSARYASAKPSSKASKRKK